MLKGEYERGITIARTMMKTEKSLKISAIVCNNMNLGYISNILTSLI